MLDRSGLEYPKSTFSFADFDEDEGEMLMKQGFDAMELPQLRRVNTEGNQYYIYTSKTEFTTVHANTVSDALEQAAIARPFKVEHAHCRMPDLIKKEGLAFINTLDPVDEPGVESEAVAEIAAAAPEGVEAEQSEPTPEAPSSEPAKN